jgi:hypothetical protein
MKVFVLNIGWGGGISRILITKGFKDKIQYLSLKPTEKENLKVN